MKYFFSIMFFLGSSTILAEETQEQKQIEAKTIQTETQTEENNK